MTMSGFVNAEDNGHPPDNLTINITTLLPPSPIVIRGILLVYDVGIMSHQNLIPETIA